MRNLAILPFFKRFLRPEWPVMALVVGMILVFALSGGAFAWLTGQAVGVVVDQGSVRGLVLIVVAILALALLRGALGFLQTWMAGQAGLRVHARVNDALMSRLLVMNSKRVRDEGAGTWIEKVRGDATILIGLTAQLAIFVSEALSTIVYLAVAAWQSWVLLVSGLVVLAVLSWVLAWINGQINRRSHEVREANETTTHHLSDVLQAHGTVLAEGAESFEQNRWSNVIAHLNAVLSRHVRALASFQPAMEASVGLAFALVVGGGGFLVLRDQAELAALFSFLIAFILAGQSFQRVQKVVANAQPLFASIKRVMTIVDSAEPERTSGLEPGPIHVENLSVIRAEGGLHDLSFSVATGSFTAIVGPSGGGKTTLLSCLAGFEEWSQGSVRLGGTDPRFISPEARRKSLGLLLQNTSLLEGSVPFNVAYGEDEEDQERLARALTLAGVQDLSNSKSIKDLSGGEKQRVALARLLYRNPFYLFLDEPLSALDAQTEARVMENLITLKGAHTLVLVTHSLSSLEQADEILVIDQGRVVQRGDFSALKHQGLFARLLSSELRQS